MGEVIDLAEYRRQRRPELEIGEHDIPELTGLHAAAEFIDRQEIYAYVEELIENRDEIQAEVPQQERRDNARTALWEALTASGHLSRVEIEGDTIEAIHRQVVARLLNGWSENLPGHEKQRRFLELCEEAVIFRAHKAIEAGELPPSTEVGVISDYPTGLANKSAAAIGYRYMNLKGMVRSTKLEQRPGGGYKRVLEQISRSNGTSKTTFAFLQNAAIKMSPGEKPDLVALDTPYLYSTEDLADGVVDIQRHLDRHAGPGVMYGDDKTEKADHIPYESLRTESARREAELERYVDKLADFEARLDVLYAAGKITWRERTNQYKQEILQTLRQICVVRPQYATETFGEKAATFYYRASDAAASGNFDMAAQILNEAKQHEEVVIICGGALSEKEAKQLGVSLTDLAEGLSDSAANMEWAPGFCRVPKCPSPRPCKVGPCSVCELCQSKFDGGLIDSSKFYTRRTTVVASFMGRVAQPRTIEPVREEMPQAA